jgi:uncharacterized protein YcnI
VKTRIALLTAAAALVLVPAAAAHVTANPTEAPADGFAMITFRVPHGCEDSPTTSLSIRIPDGVLSVTPQAVPGWDVETTTGKLAQPIQSEGETITEGVKQVTWSGGSLDPHQFTDFGISMRMPNSPGETLAFPAIQRCAEGETRWIQIPTAGGPEPDTPAPTVTLTAATGGHGGGATGSTGAEETAGDDSAEAASATDADDDGSGMEVAAMALGAAGLVAGLAALGLTWRRTRRT